MASHDLAISADVKWIGEPSPECRARRTDAAAHRGPFYLPPLGYEHAAPGTVLRSRDVEVAFLGVIPQRFTATQLLYRSNDLNRRADAAVTTVLIPDHDDAARRCRSCRTSAPSTP